MNSPAPDNATEPDAEVTARLRRFTQTRDPRALWPHLTTPVHDAARASIERAVRAVLADDRHRNAPLDAEGEPGAQALGVAAFTTGTGALLARWIEDGRVRAPAAVAEVLRAHLHHGRQRAQRIERGVLPAFDALLARGITPVVVKGFHTARAYCEEPGVRPMADADVVVPPESVATAEAALEAAGFRPTTRAKSPYKREWKAVDVDERVFSVERPDARSRWQLELHASFDRDFFNRPGPGARLDSERQHVAPLRIAGRALLAPSQPLLLLVLACQLSSELGSMRLMRLIDLVRVVRTDRANGTLDWDEVLAAFRRTGAAQFTYPALAMAEDLAPGTIEPRVLEAARVASTWGARHVVDRLAPAGRTADSTSLIERFMWAESPWGILRGALGKVARSAAPNGRGVGQWRAFLRHIVNGRLTIGAPDERAE